MGWLGKAAGLLAVVALATGCARAGEEGATTTEATSTTTTVAETTTTSTTRPAATATTGSAMAVDCGTIGFTPASEDAASQIRATGVGCAEARAFVTVAGQRTSAEGPAQLDVDGYRCVRTRAVQDPLPVASYTCTSGAKRITFDRS